MGDLATYSLADFVAVTPEVYLRLFARQNVQLWPSQLVTVVIGFVLLYCARCKDFRYGHLGLAVVWVWSGITFHFNLYAELNWAAIYFGYGFFGQALLHCLREYVGSRQEEPEAFEWNLGIAVAGFSLILYPLIVVVFGNSWTGIQLFGTAPPTTALATVGFITATRRPRWFLMIIPVIWCAISSLQCLAMGLYWGLIPGVVAVGAVMTAFFEDRKTDG